MTNLRKKHVNALLLMLLNSLADFDGQLSPDAVNILHELRQRSDAVPPLYADVFALPHPSTGVDFVKRIESLSQQQRAIASYAFQIFRSYEQMLRVDTTQMSPEQKAAQESQLERIRLVVARAKTAIVEALQETS